MKVFHAGTMHVFPTSEFFSRECVGITQFSVSPTLLAGALYVEPVNIQVDEDSSFKDNALDLDQQILHARRYKNKICFQLELFGWDV